MEIEARCPHSVRRLAWMIALASVVLLLSPFGDPSARGSESGAACSKQVTRVAVTNFLSAFNRGDLKALDSLFATKPKFQWYSSPSPGRRLGPPSRRRDTLVGYFRSRHLAGERMSLRSFDFNGPSPRWSNFSYSLNRRSEKFQEGKWFRTLGKGSVECSLGTPQIIVMSIGGPMTLTPAKAAALPSHDDGSSDAPVWFGAGLCLALLTTLGVVHSRRWGNRRVETVGPEKSPAWRADRG